MLNGKLFDYKCGIMPGYEFLDSIIMEGQMGHEL